MTHDARRRVKNRSIVGIAEAMNTHNTQPDDNLPADHHHDDTTGGCVSRWTAPYVEQDSDHYRQVIALRHCVAAIGDAWNNLLLGYPGQPRPWITEQITQVFADDLAARGTSYGLLSALSDAIRNASDTANGID